MSLSLAEELLIPHGWIDLSDTFFADSRVERYVNRECVIPHKMPQRHPLLIEAAMEPVTLPRPFPTWWNDCIVHAPFPLRFFLPSITVEEFYSGIVDEDRWKLFRTFLPDEKKRLVPQSPKIGKFFDVASSWSRAYGKNFSMRGQSTENSVITYHLSTRPEDLFFMSNGAGWDSCQHYRTGSYKSNLVGSMYDRNLGMLYTLSEGRTFSDDDALEARALVRTMYFPGSDKPVFALDRVYGNNKSVEETLPAALRSFAAKVNARTGVLASPHPCVYVYNQVVVPSGYSSGYHDNVSSGDSFGISYENSSYDVLRLRGTIGVE